MTAMFETLFVLALTVPPLVLVLCVLGLAVTSLVGHRAGGRRFEPHAVAH
jgi:hypothetical protein